MNRIFRAVGIAAAMIASATTASAAPLTEQLVPQPGYVAPVEDGSKQGETSQPTVAVAGIATLSIQRAFVLAADRVEAPVKQSLDELVGVHSASETQDPEQECLAGAVYFEARGESLDGQLAVAEVVLNRAASGRFPATICKVVTQPWQFSFVRGGRFPRVDKDSAAWRKAVAIAHIARAGLADRLASNVLWYHANYVSPSWGKRLSRQARIGVHIFYS